MVDLSVRKMLIALSGEKLQGAKRGSWQCKTSYNLKRTVSRLSLLWKKERGIHSGHHSAGWLYDSMKYFEVSRIIVCFGLNCTAAH